MEEDEDTLMDVEAEEGRSVFLLLPSICVERVGLMLPPKSQPILGVPVASSADSRAPAAQMLEPNSVL
jgi:hypothetical protein